MYRRTLYLGAAIALNAHSFFTMPPWQPDTWQRLAQMALRDFENIEPLAFTLFVLFGMFSLLLAVLVLLDGKHQRFPAWPFALSMMVLGPSMVFIYQAFRSEGTAPQRQAPVLQRVTESRVLPVLIAAISLGALWDGRGGDPSQLWHLFQTDYITHAMVVDELLFVLLTPILVNQDVRRRQLHKGWVIAALCLPIFGACAYLFYVNMRGGKGNSVGSAAA